MNELLRFIDGFQEMDTETVEAIRRYFVKETFKKDQFLVEEGKICSKVYFVQSGLIRRFYMDNGLETTEWIYCTNQWTTSLSSFFEQRPSFEFLQACEKTVVYSLSYSDEQKLLEYPLFLRFHVKQLRLYLSKLNEFHHLYKLMNAHDKYNYLLTYFPEIIQKAKLKHIASLMDISQETLSRIRASIT